MNTEIFDFPILRFEKIDPCLSIILDELDKALEQNGGFNVFVDSGAMRKEVHSW